jgi:hypothetical protein
MPLDDSPAATADAPCRVFAVASFTTAGRPRRRFRSRCGPNNGAHSRPASLCRSDRRFPLFPLFAHPLRREDSILRGGTVELGRHGRLTRKRPVPPASEVVSLHETHETREGCRPTPLFSRGRGSSRVERKSPEMHVWLYRRTPNSLGVVESPIGARVRLVSLPGARHSSGASSLHPTSSVWISCGGGGGVGLRDSRASDAGGIGLRPVPTG